METSGENEILEWINTFDCVKDLGLKTTNDLLTTKAIALVWNSISPSKIVVENLQVPKNETDWLQILKNLRAIDGVVGPVLTERNFRVKVDLTSLSRNKNPADVVKYMCPFILIGMTCADRVNVITNIKKCSKQTQAFLTAYIKASNLKPGQNSAPKTEQKHEQTQGNKPEIKTENVKETKQAPEQPAESHKHDENTKTEIQNEEKIKLAKIISEKTKEIEVLRQEIIERESKLQQIKEAAPKNAGKIDKQQEAILENVESMIEKVLEENKNLKGQLVSKRGELDQTKNEIMKLQGIIEFLDQYRNKSAPAQENTEELQQGVEKLQKAIEAQPLLYKEIATLKQSISDANDEMKKIDSEVTNVKESLKTSIQIATKYDDVGEVSGDEHFEDDGKDVMQLMITINNLEVELASGTPQGIEEEHMKYKKYITKLDKYKKKLEKDNVTVGQMRDEMQRVQQELIGRRESVEENINQLSNRINERNEEITRWLALSTALKSTKNASPTLISELRKQKF